MTEFNDVNEALSELKNVARVCEKAAQTSSDEVLKALASSVNQAAARVEAAMSAAPHLNASPGLGLGSGHSQLHQSESGKEESASGSE